MDNLIVQKYGGSSIANPERIEAVSEIIASSLKKGLNLVVVLSAMGDSTDKLINLSIYLSVEVVKVAY